MPSTTTRKRKPVPNPAVKALARRIKKMDTTQLTARDISERLGGQPLYLVYAALLELGRTTDAGDYLATFYTAEEPQPLYERVAQIDTSEMSIEEIAERFDTTPNRARSALSFLGRFARRGGYKPPSQVEAEEAAAAEAEAEAAKQEEPVENEPSSAPKPATAPTRRLVFSRRDARSRLRQRNASRRS